MIPVDEPTATTADLLGLPLSHLELDGERWELREATPVERGRYQRWLEDELRAAARRDVDSPDPAGDMLRVNERIAAGACHFDGPMATARRETPEGQAKLWEIMYALPPDKAEKVQRANAERVAELARKAVLDGDPKAAGALLGPLLRLLGLSSTFFSETLGTGSARRPSKSSRTGRRARSGPSTAPTGGTTTASSCPPPPSPGAAS